MDKKKLGFVILHYCTTEMTIQSVAAVKEKMADSNYEIVIVDNASYNGSGKELLKRYEKDDKVTVLLSEENIGFAKGNNIGYSYAKNQLSCDFICVMNNDVMVEQKDFAERIFREFEKSSFAVLGPHITLKNGQENAMYYKINPVETLIKERNGYIKRLKRVNSRLCGMWKIWDNMKRIVRIFLGKIHVMEELKLHEDMVEGARERHENIILHGCCLIFSPKYLEKFEDAFDPATFMFREEEILYLRCMREQLLMVYNPELEVLHLEDVSTDFIYKSNRKKEIFNLENQIASLKILIQKLQEEDKGVRCEKSKVH